MELSKLKMNKKGQIGGLSNFVVQILVVFIVVAITAFVAVKLSESFGAGSAAANVTDELVTQVDTNVPLLGIVLTIGIVVVVIGLVSGSFRTRA